jgi:RNA polymerase primary sigma factor
MHNDCHYHVSVMRELRDQQVRFAPRDKRIDQVNRAERLVGEIDPDRTYSYEYLYFRITDFRPESAPALNMTGADAQHDLRLFVEDVSDSVNVRVEDAGEPVHTVEELSTLFNVSTKTISRWRDQGLVSRRFVFDGGRKRVGFLHSSVERFVTGNSERIKRGEKFSQLSPDEKSDMLARARRMAATGNSPTEVIRRVASQLGRSPETVRYTIRSFDEQHPDQAVFPEHAPPLTDEVKHQIFTLFRQGVSVDAIAMQFHRTRSAIYRVVNESRCQRLMDLPLDFIPNPGFEKNPDEDLFLGAMPESEISPRKVRGPSGLPPYLQSLYEVPLLTREQEAHLFRKLNYLKFKAGKLRSDLDPARAKASVMDQIERLYDDAVAVKNQIVQSNLRLVVSIAKRHVNANTDFFSLVSDGNMSLIRAVEKFDFARGNKFSTYASWAIMKNFARTIPEEFKHRDRFRTSQDEAFTAEPDARTDQVGLELAQSLREAQVEKILSVLDEREAAIIIRRFGLEQGPELTLKEVGEEIGVTKERVRQIEARALSKLRQAAEKEHIDLPDE